jgi:hypothetical protein
MRVWMRAYEIEHGGDVEGAAEAVRRAGGEVVRVGEPRDEQVGIIADFPRLAQHDLNVKLDAENWCGEILKID